MYISTDLSHDRLTAIMTRVSDDYYNGNLTFNLEELSRNRYRFEMGATPGKRGNRTAARGRRGPWACWDAFRDVLAAIYIADHKAHITTHMVRYRSAREFISGYQFSTERSIGGPVSHIDLCDCDFFAPAYLLIELRETLEDRANLTY